MAHKQKLRSFHLFAGAGGGILADLILGHEVIGACEIEKYPRDVLLARQRDGILPSFPIWDDVRELDGNPWRGAVDILCGGFPCQDISSAGKGAGITGERSGLWKEYARLIGEMRPRFVFAENSPLLRTRGLGVVLEDLASLGYNARWGIIGAGDVGAWHQRKRLWLLASDNLQKRVKGEWPQSVARKLRLPGCENVRRLEDLQGRPDIPDSLIRGDRNGVPSYVDRIAAIGNAQVPQVAAMAFSILSEGLI
jgi:DNA (cytosine-5)-methyltransferase 1